MADDTLLSHVFHSHCSPLISALVHFKEYALGLQSKGIQMMNVYLTGHESDVDQLTSVHICSTASTRSGTSRPPRDVIAVERFRNGSGWLCGVNGQLDPFRNRSSQRGPFGSLICACLAVDLVLSTPLHKNEAYFIGK